MSANPFLKKPFMDALAEAGCIGKERGWDPVELSADSEKIFSFVKNHSYGEYIFDWSWAEAYARHGVAYYPKLTSMIPFTPVTTEHLFHPHSDGHQILKTFDDYYSSGPFSSSHFLFLPPAEISMFKHAGYFIRHSLQYHWINEGHRTFEEYLGSFKTKKAKTLRSERLFPTIQMTKFTGASLTDVHAKRMYQFYLSTIENKQSYDYLNESFFLKVFKTMAENILYVEACRGGEAIAGSLFFFDEQKLYGRYWGATEFAANLHFELCYYQGIDFCLENGLSYFEAGAQGEHKIARGFRPTIVSSAHKIKHPDFSQAIGDFIEKEKLGVEQNLKELTKLLPFSLKS